MKSGPVEGRPSVRCPVCEDPRVAVVGKQRGLCRRHLQMYVDAEVLLLNFADPDQPPQMAKCRRKWGPNWADA